MSLHFVFFYKIGEPEDGTGSAWGVGTSGMGEDVGKECGRMSIMQILYTHECKWKNETC
jgi:hypothetical protein